MESTELTLKERACRMYRQLLILQHVFRQQSSDDEADEVADGVVLREAVKEMVDELREHAGVLMSAPFPISEWRTGDGSDDERWRALTEIECRELLALISEYEKLIAWNTTVSQNRAAGVDNLGLATTFTKGPSFGTATGNTVSNGFLSNIPAYPLAFSGATPGGRTMRLAVGFRF